MIHLLIGAAGMGGFFLLKDFVQRKGLQIRVWHWALAVLGILYGVFVLEVVYGFLLEGAARAAMVMGLTTGLVAVIWGVLLARLVFKPAK